MDNLEKNKLVMFFAILLMLLITFGINMALAPEFTFNQLLSLRLGLVFASGLGFYLSKKKEKHNFKDIFFSVLAVNIAFTVVMFFTTELWNLNIQTAKGLAFAKLSDGAVLSLVVIILFLAAGYKWKDMYIVKGRLFLGIAIGIVLFSLMAYLAIFQPGKEISEEFLRKNAIWILIFILSNAFMEELLFRGIFLQQISKYVKPGLAVLLTSIVFALAHIQVLYAPNLLMFLLIVFVLGLLWALLMRFTKSIIASVLFHAGADILIIIDIFRNYSAGI